MLITVEVRGLAEAVARLSKLADGRWKGDLLVTVGALVQRQTTERIRSEKSSPAGAAWAGWSAETGAGKKRGSGLLVDTGRLMGSIAATVAGDTARIGTNLFYAVFHQSGTSKMPAREFLGLSDANASEMESVVRAFIARKLAL